MSQYLRNDFTYTYNAEGYMIQYKGHNIGGAGIIGKSKSRGKNRMADLKMYKEIAESDINSICTATGSKYIAPYLLKAIEEIDNKQN